MKNKAIILISLLLIITIANLGAVVASEEVDIDDNIDTVQMNEVSNNGEIELYQDYNKIIDDNEDLSNLELENADEGNDIPYPWRRWSSVLLYHHKIPSVQGGLLALLPDSYGFVKLQTRGN